MFNLWYSIDEYLKLEKQLKIIATSPAARSSTFHRMRCTFQSVQSVGSSCRRIVGFPSMFRCSSWSLLLCVRLLSRSLSLILSLSVTSRLVASVRCVISSLSLCCGPHLPRLRLRRKRGHTSGDCYPFNDPLLLCSVSIPIHVPIAELLPYFFWRNFLKDMCAPLHQAEASALRAHPRSRRRIPRHERATSSDSGSASEACPGHA